MPAVNVPREELEAARQRGDWAFLAQARANFLATTPSTQPDDSTGLAAVTYALLALRDTIASEGEQLRNVITEHSQDLDKTLDTGFFQLGLEMLGISETLSRPGLLRQAARRIRCWLTRDRQPGPDDDAPYVLARTRCPNPAGQWVLAEGPGRTMPRLPGGEAYLDGPADMSLAELSLWASAQLGWTTRLERIGEDPDGPVYAVRPAAAPSRDSSGTEATPGE